MPQVMRLQSELIFSKHCLTTLITSRGRESSRFAYERIPTIADHTHYAQKKYKKKKVTQGPGGGHAHCGTMVYLGDNWPARYRNTLFTCNLHGKRMNNDILSRRGSGYIASHGPDLMLSLDPWFMGITIRTGPFGTVSGADVNALRVGCQK